MSMRPRADKPEDEDRRDAETLRHLLQVTGGGTSAYEALPKSILAFLETATKDELRMVLALVLARWREGEESAQTESGRPEYRL